MVFHASMAGTKYDPRSLSLMGGATANKALISSNLVDNSRARPAPVEKPPTITLSQECLRITKASSTDSIHWLNFIFARSSGAVPWPLSLGT